MLLLVLLACHGAHDSGSKLPDDSGDADTDTDTDADTDTDTDTDHECAGGEPPALARDAWSPATAIPAGSIVSFATADGTFPLYASGKQTGMWGATGSTFAWDEKRPMRDHSYADLYVWPSDPLRVYHSAGGMLHVSQDGGETWRQLPLGNIGGHHGLTQVVLGFCGRGEELWGMLSDGLAAWSGDGGESWEIRGDSGEDWRDGWSYDWRLVCPAADGETLFFTDGEDLFRSPDGGWTFQPVRPDLAGPRSVARAADGRVVVGYGSGYALTDDDGDTWTETETGWPVQQATFTADGTLAVAGGGRVALGGVEHALPVDPILTLGAVDGWLLAGHNDGVHVSGDGGATWSFAGMGMYDQKMSVIVPHPTCPDRVFIGSRCTGGVYRSEDWGETWEHDAQYFHYVMSLHFDPQDVERVWAVSDNALLRSDDGGYTWLQVHDAYHYHGFAVHPDDSDTLLIGSVGSGEWADERARIFRSEDGGHTWSDVSTGLPDSPGSAHTIVYWPGKPEVVLTGTYKGGDASHQSGEGIGLYRSTDGGDTWALVDLPELDIAWLEPVEGGVWAATLGGLYHSEDEGVTWTRVDGVDGEMLSVTFEGEVGLAYESTVSQVWATRDGGATWAPLGFGLPPSGGTTLAQVGISAGGAVGYVTIFGTGIWRIAL